MIPRDIASQLGSLKQVRSGHASLRRKKVVLSVAAQIEAEIKARQARTRKLGPYKAAQTIAARMAADRIETAMRRKR